MKLKKAFLMVLLVLLVSSSQLFSQVLESVITVTDFTQRQGNPQAAYNSSDDEYLVVWEDFRNGNWDIYGQLVKADGTLRGGNFPICNLAGNQYLPHLDFDPYMKRYLVVFKDQRNYTTLTRAFFNIYGCLLESDGRKIATAISEADTCFRISFNTGGEDTWPAGKADWPSVSFNWLFEGGSYLVVWSEVDNMKISTDIKGQLISDSGNLVQRAGMAKPAEGLDNFFISERADRQEDITDITYNYVVNEWFVVFTSLDQLVYDVRIFGQRVRDGGILLQQDGTIGYGPLDCSGVTGNGPPCSWPCAQANSEYFLFDMAKPAYDPAGIQCETLVGWRTFGGSGNWNDIFGQRIAFFTDKAAVDFGWKQGPVVESKFFAAYCSKDAVASSDSLMPFPIANGLKDQNHFDLAYSRLGNEFMCGWGDGRNTDNWRVQDLYLQLMRIGNGDTLKLVGLDHLSEIPSTENVPVSIDTSIFEGGYLYTGLAHNAKQDEFLLAYSYSPDAEANTEYDIHARRISGAAVIPVEPIVLSGFVDDFNDGLSDYWVPEDGGGFVLTESGGVLQIDVDKERDFAAVTFIPYPDYLIDMSANPYISVKVKASKDVMLQIGATNLDQGGNPNAVPTALYSGPGKGHENVMGGSDWVTMVFNYTDVFEANSTAGDQIHIFYFNFNPANQWIDPSGGYLWNGTVWLDDFRIGDQADLSEVRERPGMPKAFSLVQNYPNPFNPSTTIEIQLPAEDHVRLTVFDLQGRAVKTLADKPHNAGYHSLVWDGKNGSGQEVTSGVYIYQVQTSKNLVSRKMILMR